MPILGNESANYSDASDDPCLLWAMTAVRCLGGEDVTCGVCKDMQRRFIGRRQCVE